MQTGQKPTLVNVIAWTTLTSGIVNLFWGLIASGTALATIVGIFCTPFTILPTILGVFEIIYAAKLLSNPAQPVQPSNAIAIFEIACALTGNIFAMVVGILALVFYNDLTVKDYFAKLNGTFVPPVPVVPPTPAPAPESQPREPVEDEAAPDMPEPGPSEVEEPADEPPLEEAPAPPPEETPAKPKRTPRKAAKK
jgi:hypothetical protein